MDRIKLLKVMKIRWYEWIFALVMFSRLASVGDNCTSEHKLK